jgi:hydrogenase maturation protein HypF
MGRLFDGVASLLSLSQRVTFEAQAAMALEFIADSEIEEAYPLPLLPSPSALLLDWYPLISAILHDLDHHIPAAIIAARFHNALIEAIVAVADRSGHSRIALSGGVWQNRLLSERAWQRLRAKGFEVILHRQVPPNDGGISLGQIAVAARKLNGSTKFPNVTSP